MESKHTVAVSTNSFHGFDVMDALDVIADTGFKNVEICAVRNWTEHVMPEMSEDQIRAICEKAAERGLRFISMSGHCDLSDEERLQDFRKNIALAGRLGCEWIVSSTGEAHFMKEGSENDTEQILIRNIKSLIPDLKKYGLKLAIEVHGANYGTGESLKRIIDGVGEFPTVGINYDTANVVYWGKSNPSVDILTCKDQITYCHLKDKLGMDSSWNFPPLGTGELDLVGLIHEMDKPGCDVPLSIELEYTEGFTMREKEPGDLAFAADALKTSYEFLKANGLI